MANWLTPGLLSRKYGIPESTLRSWKCLGYIVSSTIDNEVLLDEDSLNRCLNAHSVQGLQEGYLEKIIKEKKQEKEALLSQFDDELFLLKTQKPYQPLFHILIQKLGQLIADDRLKEIFLTISSGEPISRVAARHKMTYEQTLRTYKTILKGLEKNTDRITTCLNKKPDSVFDRFATNDPTHIELYELLPFRICGVLYSQANINTVRDLLKYTSKKGWQSLKRLHGIGNIAYAQIIKELLCANFITTDKDGNIELSPEVVALMI